MKRVEILKEKVERNKFKNSDIEIFEYRNQIIFINKLFLDEEFDDRALLIKELEKKLNSYKHQDIDKKLLDEKNLINLSEIIEKLVSSKLKCYYCKQKIFLFYRNVRDDYQWTLDRIDNSLGHNHNNTLISCLKCNLQRRRRGMEAFKFTKQLKIKKTG